MPIIVLIVEDEFLLRLHATDMAVDAGYVVLEAANADEAITILESRSDVRIVFTDIQMPGSMDSVKLVNAIRDRWPPVALIVTSGQIRPGPNTLPANVQFLTKPYLAAELTEALRLAI